MNTNIKNLIENADKIHVDYIGWRNNKYRYGVDLVRENDNVTDVSIRFVDDESLNGVILNLKDGDGVMHEPEEVEMHKCEFGEEGCYIGDVTKEDIVALLPIYCRNYLDKYARLYKEDEEFVEDMKNEGVIGIRDDFTEFCFSMKVCHLKTEEYDKVLETETLEDGTTIRRPYAIES